MRKQYHQNKKVFTYPKLFNRKAGQRHEMPEGYLNGCRNRDIPRLCEHRGCVSGS